MKSGLIITVAALLLYTSFVLVCVAKECTNTPTQLSSHTFRYDLLQSKNETLKTEMFSHYHLTPTDDTAWSSLLPRKMLREEEDEFGWTMMYRNFKNSNSSGSFLKEVSLHDVRLDPNTFHWRAQQTNLEYLLMLDVDALTWSFRKEAGLDAPGDPYGGWERPDSELRGHFVGHYLSATAYMWASTHNDTLKAKMSALVEKTCCNDCLNKRHKRLITEFTDSPLRLGGELLLPTSTNRKRLQHPPLLCDVLFWFQLTNTRRRNQLPDTKSQEQRRNSRKFFLYFSDHFSHPPPLT